MARICFLGTPEVAVPSLEAIVAAGHDVVTVISQPDRRRGRGSTTTPSPVKAAALRLGLRVTDELQEATACDAQLGVVVAFGRIIPDEILALVPMVNIQFSLLPRWRGAAPLERAILAGDEMTGVCLMEVASELDAGGVYASASTEVGEKTLDELREELASLGAELLVAELAKGLGEATAQAGEVSYARKLTPSDFELDIHGTAEAAARLVRLGRAFISHSGRRLRVHSARLAQIDSAATPGNLDGTVLSFADGSLELLEVQPESRKPMGALDWRRGLGADVVVLGRQVEGP